jgi:hypothetical protein
MNYYNVSLAISGYAFMRRISYELYDTCNKLINDARSRYRYTTIILNGMEYDVISYGYGFYIAVAEPTYNHRLSNVNRSSIECNHIVAEQ